MKFTVNRDVLLEPLQLTTSVVERKQTMPILANLLVTADENGLQIVGTDQEVELRSRVSNVTVEEAGEVTLPGRKLLDITRHLPADVEMAFESEDNRVSVVSGDFDSQLATLPVIEFPTIDAVTPSVTFSLPISDLKELLEKTSFAMATQDVRYFFNGLLIECGADLVRCVATNGQRLAVSEMAGVATGVDDGRFIVPRKGVVELTRMLGSAEEGTATLQFSENHLLVTAGDSAIVSRLIDATYPDYQQAIPGEGDKTLVCERETLRTALIRAAILSNEVYKNVRLALSGGGLEIHANNPLQEQAKEKVAIEYDGDALEIGFNVNYLIEALTVVKGDKVHMSFTDANSACLLTDPDDIKSRYVISPMML